LSVGTRDLHWKITRNRTKSIKEYVVTLLLRLW
jgi:hypothetical protein